MKNKQCEFILQIQNHVCCDSCLEVYMTTIDCPICENSIAIELEDKEAECDCGSKFRLCKTDAFEIIATLYI